MMGLVDHYANRKDQGKIETWNNGQMAETIEALILKYPDINEKKCNEALRGLITKQPNSEEDTMFKRIFKHIENRRKWNRTKRWMQEHAYTSCRLSVGLMSSGALRLWK